MADEHRVVGGGVLVGRVHGGGKRGRKGWGGVGVRLEGLRG